MNDLSLQHRRLAQRFHRHQKYLIKLQKDVRSRRLSAAQLLKAPQLYFIPLAMKHWQ